ncbi:bile acid-sensitive ion channel-like isoform X2 [Tachypleus tridentatus]|uniref:bile acid-sensitive ion channel-like isoform X2 n=1 Tax=Tachypleus tridentatus TaxID=6853 RepID=UPI003FD614F6
MISFKTLPVIFNYTFRLSVLVGCFAGFIFQALEFVEFYYEYQTTVEIKIEPVDEIPLPSVTFCYKSKMNFSHWCIIRPDDCLTNLTYTTDVIKWNHYKNSLTVAEMKEAGIQLDKVLVLCNFVGFDNCDPIYKTYTTMYGNCFTFNSDWMPESVVRNMSSSQTVVGGKKMHVYFYLYLDNNVTYPMTNDALIVLGSPDSVPDIINDAYFIEPGKIHTFSVSKSISNLLPPPYATNCTNYDKMGRTSLRAGLLIQETCFVECLANLTLEMCGCMYDDYPYLYDLPGPVRPCQQSMEEGVCKTNPLKSETVDARHYCEDLCRTPCRFVLPTERLSMKFHIIKNHL